MGRVGKALLLGASVLPLSPIVSSAWAQEGADQGSTDRVIITGTAIRGVAPVGSATLNVERETLVEAPVRDATEIIRSLPQASGLGIQEAGGGFNVSRGSGVNLRGLGNNATLVLIDGHRLAGQGVISQYADPSQIPFAAIERVEVVTDGASAIYGSDAVAGVVNYILRRDVEGLEITARKGGSEYYDTWSVDAVGGLSWTSGAIILGGSYDFRGAMRQGENPLLRQDLTRYGFNDFRFQGTTNTPGIPGNIVANSRVYGIPTGVPLTAANILARVGQPNLADTSDYLDYLPERTRTSVYLRARQEIGSSAEVSYSLLYSDRDSFTRRQGTTNIRVLPTSPYYIPGITTDPFGYLVSYNLAKDGVPLQNTANYDVTENHTVDLRVDLASDWQLNAYVTRGTSEGCGTCQRVVHEVLPNLIANPPFTGFDPYSTTPNPTGAASLFADSIQAAKFGLWDYVAKLDGPVFSLPAGQVRLAVGGEFAKSSMAFNLVTTNRNLDTPRRFETQRNNSTEREVTSVFGEAYLPIFSGQNAIPGFQSLDISAAVRYDDYSDFGATTNPKVGVTWEPIGDLLVRGTWGTSFRAPSLTENNPGVLEFVTATNVTNAAGDPTIPVNLPVLNQSTVLTRTGNTAGLEPETADVWSLGFELQPSWLEGFRGSVTYYNVSYQNRIENVPNLNGALSSAANRQLYRDFIIAAPQPSTCVNGNQATYNPLYLPFLRSPTASLNLDSIPNLCALTAILNGGQRNLGDQEQNGVDVSATYDFATGIGDFTIGATYSKILDLKKQLVPNGPLVDVLDTMAFQVGNRGRFNLGWRVGGFSANAFLNYIGEYQNTTGVSVRGTVVPRQNVDSWKTLDATFAYDFSQGWASDLRVSLNVQNVTDEDPPLVYNGQNVFDIANANPYGRIWNVEISKRF